MRGVRLSKEDENKLIEANILNPESKSFGPIKKGGKPYKSKKQQESILQREIIDSLHARDLGKFFRIRNGATFDANIGRYRSNTTVKGIPDIIGHTKKGIAVYIEVKIMRTNKAKDGKIKEYKGAISQEQKDFLLEAEDSGCIAGIAFNANDAYTILKRNQEIFPRHPRTYAYKDKEWLKDYKLQYANLVHELAIKKQDPFFRDVLLPKLDRED